ncbi:PstS family phosphate ABC transporter substrate-binding protein [Edaphobacter bradus]|uniref:PstS family phosphate ABC transporter substrate-binding protein n=1 Tax=Edaphobacter bradus TaxID=2259016 RepID=UPI0021DFF12E|nr:substrate-binding domain-containing protein [Edaphobacter bradus]
MTMRRLVPIAGAVVLLAAPLADFGQQPDFLKDLKPYQPQQKVSGTIRNWGNNYIPALMKEWEDGFRKYQPDVQFETNLKGTEASLAGLYGGIADLTFIGREGYRSEINGFYGRFGYYPLGVEISSGSFNTPHKTFALMVFVHKDNPLAHLTMEQAQAIFGCSGDLVVSGTGSCERATHKPIRTWGEAGLSGQWKDRPVHVYGYNFDTGMAGYFNRVTLNDSGRWNEDLKDFDNGHEANGEVINAGVYVLAALAKDPNGIAFANILYTNPDVKMLALGGNASGPFVYPTVETAWRREYPITRFTTVYLNRVPGQPVDAKVKEFLRYILSRDGMAAVAKDGAYLPLNEKVIEEQLRKLE